MGPDAEYLWTAWKEPAASKWHRLNKEGVSDTDARRVFHIGAYDYRRAERCGATHIFGLKLINSGL